MVCSSHAKPPHWMARNPTHRAGNETNKTSLPQRAQKTLNWVSHMEQRNNEKCLCGLLLPERALLDIKKNMVILIKVDCESGCASFSLSFPLKPGSRYYGVIGHTIRLSQSLRFLKVAAAQLWVGGSSGCRDISLSWLLKPQQFYIVSLFW